MAIHRDAYGPGKKSGIPRGGLRTAATSINALLNYLYAVLETEVRLAILTLGLDPSMGILHADQKSRDSFVFDVIEPLRPVVDGRLLDMLERRTFGKREFFETRQGACRLMPSLPLPTGRTTFQERREGESARVWVGSY